MHDGKRRAGVALAQLHGAEERRSIPVLGDVGQEATELYLGMLTGMQAPQHFHDEPVVDDGGGVRLLALDALHVLDHRRRHVGKGLSRREFDVGLALLYRVDGVDITQTTYREFS